MPPAGRSAPARASARARRRVALLERTGRWDDRRRQEGRATALFFGQHFHGTVVHGAELAVHLKRGVVLGTSEAEVLLDRHDGALPFGIHVSSTQLVLEHAQELAAWNSRPKPGGPGSPANPQGPRDRLRGRSGLPRFSCAVSTVLAG
jgi:hypothetical protein